MTGCNACGGEGGVVCEKKTSRRWMRLRCESCEREDDGESVHGDAFDGRKARHVGIVALQVYVPKRVVRMDELERYDNVTEGKYTRGLEQNAMAFCGDREDVHSMSLTVLKQLMELHRVPPDAIGRLEVGTESSLDRSKSVKTTLMSALCQDGAEVEGLDCVNACYGGTQALMNTVAWMESSLWTPGKLGVVVCADIALYSPSAARATGGAGAIAILVGPDAPLVLEPELRATWMEHAYDFFKPDPGSEYPELFGHQTVACFFRALDKCYSRYRRRAHAAATAASNQSSLCQQHEPFSLRKHAAFALFHAPFHKLVRKAFSRLLLADEQDALAASALGLEDGREAPRRYEPTEADNSGVERSIESERIRADANEFNRMVEPGHWFAREIGNAYTASLYISLACLLSSEAADEESAASLISKRIVLFSFGSGFAASMITFRVRSSRICAIVRPNAIQALQADRRMCSVDEYLSSIQSREQIWARRGVIPRESIERTMRKGTVYLKHIDKHGRRFYETFEPGSVSSAQVEISMPATPEPPCKTCCAFAAAAEAKATNSHPSGSVFDPSSDLTPANPTVPTPCHE